MLYPDVNSQKKTQQTRYRTALYLRLSREDGDKTESDSIANQRTMLEAYVADHPELSMPVPCKHRVLRAPLEQQVRIEDSHAAIVTPEEFEQAQKVIISD